MMHWSPFSQYHVRSLGLETVAERLRIRTLLKGRLLVQIPKLTRNVVLKNKGQFLILLSKAFCLMVGQYVNLKECEAGWW